MTSIDETSDPSPTTHFLSSIDCVEEEDSLWPHQNYVVLILTNKTTYATEKEYHCIDNPKDGYRLWLEINRYKNANAIISFDSKLKQAIVPS